MGKISKKIYKLIFEKFTLVFLLVIIVSVLFLFLFVVVYQNFINPSSIAPEQGKASFQQRFQKALGIINQNKKETEFTESLINIFGPR